jgi:hypothetical protein
MESCIRTTEMLEVKAIGTYDFAIPVELVKSIDLAMRCYFGADDWLAIRNSRAASALPGHNPPKGISTLACSR